MNNDFVKVEIKTLLIDPFTRMPIIVLKRDQSDEQVLPIWVGIFEANAIAVTIEEVKSPRPMTHDLLDSIISTLGAKVKRIEICDLEENTYYANIVLDLNGEELIVDSRPSDAIALSLRADSPIFVAESVFQKAMEKSAGNDNNELRQDELKRWFENLSPEIMSKFKM